MKSTCSLPTLLFILALPACAQAQKNPPGYIVTDSSYIQGNVLPMSNGRIKFSKNRKSEPIIYPAEEIGEYGYDGKVYEAMIIEGTRTFARRIASGQIKLYRHKKAYVLKIDSSLTLLGKSNFRSLLSKKVNCEGNDRLMSKVSYTDASLGSFIRAANDGNCNLNTFPHKRVGAYGGYSLLNIKLNSGSQLSFKEQKGSPTFGLFIDLPFYQRSSLSLSTELNYSNNKPLFYRESFNNTNFMALDMTVTNALIGLKWMIKKNKLKTYLKGGGLISYLNLQSPTGLVATRSNASVIEISTQAITKSDATLFGFNSAAGLEFPTRSRKTVHVEIKYTQAFTGSFDFFDLSYSGLVFVTGINF